MSTIFQVGAQFAPTLRHFQPQLFVTPATASPGHGTITFTGMVPRADATTVHIFGAQPFSTAFSLTFGSPDGVILATGGAPLVTGGVSLGSAAPGVGSILATGVAPRVDRAVAPGAGAIVGTGQAPNAGSTVAPGAGAGIATGVAPRADAGVSPGVGSVAATGGVPAAGQAVTPSIGSIAATGLAPRVDRAAQPAPGTIAATGGVPIFGTEVAPSPPVGAINFTGLTVRMSLEAPPAAGLVTAVGSIPAITMGKSLTSEIMDLLQGLGVTFPISLADLRRIIRRAKGRGLSVPVPMSLDDLAKLILSAPDTLPLTEDHVWRNNQETDYSGHPPPRPPLDRFPGSGAIVFHGQSPRVDRTAVTDFGSVVFSGSTPSILFRDPSTILFTGFSPLINRVALPLVGAILVTGKLPSGNATVGPPAAGSIVATGVGPRLDIAAVPAFGSILATGVAPRVDRAVAPGAGSVVATGVAPRDDITAAPTIGSGIATGFPPVITLGVVAPVQCSCVFTGIAPRADATVSPAVGSILATGGVPAATDVVVAPSAGSVIATGFAPTVTFLTNIVALPAPGSVVATGLVPRTDRTALPGIGSIIITGKVPILSLGSSLPGDPTGVLAFRVADMMERFGFNLFPAADPTTTGPLTTWWINPGGDGSWMKLPMQNGMNALWQRSGTMVNDVRKGNGQVEITGPGNLGGFGAPFVRGQATDPLVTINAPGKSIQVRIPIGTVCEGSNTFDNSLSGVDATQPYLYWAVNAAVMNQTDTNNYGNQTPVHSGTGNFMTCQGLGIFDGTGPLFMDAVTGAAAQNTIALDNTGGNITDYDLTQLRNNPEYFPQHMFACLIDQPQAAPFATWPVVAADGGAGGSIPEGTLIGIPADVPMPGGLSPGGRFLWRTFQQFGAFPYNTGGGAQTLGVKIYYQDSANISTAQDIANNLGNIIPHLCVYTGSTSIQNMKGMVNGVRSDAFPAPAPLDYSPTGGAPVLPSTFGAWFGSDQGRIYYNTIWPADPGSSGGGGPPGNTFGSAPADYTNDSVVAAYNFITGSSGLTMLSRVPNFKNLALMQSYLPKFTAATGSKWVMEARGAVADSIPDIVTLGGQSHNGTGTSGLSPHWMLYSEGFNEPNGAGGETATVTADGDVARFNGLSGFSEITRMSASITFGLPTPDTFISNFLNGSNLARTNASVTMWNVHYYPTQNPDFNDGGTRGNEFNDVFVGVNTGYGTVRPQFISAFHPTLFSNTNPNHGVAGWDINLPAWAAGTYALNQRFTTGGNVYQTTVAGGSTVAPTGTAADFNSSGLGATGITWNPADKSANITLSGSNAIATTSNTAQAGVRSTTSKNTGKVYYEFTPNATSSGMRMGIANATWSETATAGLGGDNNSLSVGPTSIYRLNGVASVAHSSWVAGTPVRVAIDIPNKLLWTAVGSGAWSGSTGGGGAPVVNNVVSSVPVPWGIAFLPDGSFLVSERDAFFIRHCTAAGATLGSFSVPNTVGTGAEGGLMGIAVDPNFATNGFIYISHTRSFNGSGFTQNGNEIIRYTLNATNNTISAGLILLNYASAAFHNGGGCAIGPDGKLYITTGNATSPDDTSQVLSGANINSGKILRINLDGTMPSDNPFNTDGSKVSQNPGGTRSAVWTWGHRNPQGICWDEFGNCWGTEQGPTGESFGNFSGIGSNDKINRIQKGINYGFPLCYGPNTAVDQFGVTTTPPVLTTGNGPVWAPNGIAYFGGSVFFCALGGISGDGTPALNQFTINSAGQVTSGSSVTQRLADGHRKRAANIRPNGLLYYSTTDDDGRGGGSVGQVNSIDISTWTTGSVSDPVSGVGGFSFSGIVAGPYNVAFGDTGTSGNAVTVNLGVTAFAQGLPSGFKAWAADDAHFKWQSIVDAYDSYLTAIYILDAFQKGYQGYLWDALYDFGTTYFTGLWATDSRVDPTRGPAYVLRAMYQLLGDTGPNKKTFTTTHIDYTIVGLPPPTGVQNDGGHSLLVQRSDGRFALYIWNSQQAPVGISPFTVTVTFNQNVAASVSHYDITTDPLHNMTAVDTHTNVSSVSFQMASAVHCLVIDMGSFGSTTEVISGVTIPTNIVAGTPFNVSGNISGATSVPTLEYQDIANGVASGSFNPVSGSVTTSSLSFTHPGISPALTQWYISPGRDGGFWRGVLQTTAKWITTGPLITTLRQGTPTVTNTGNAFVIGGAPNPVTGLNDPLVPITETPTGKVFSVHIPVGTVTDGFFGGVDASKPYVMWNAFGSSINGNGSIQASGSTVSCSLIEIEDGTGPILENVVTGNDAHEDSIGKMPERELLLAVADPNYYIPHKIIYALDARQFSNALIWPLNQGDTGTGNIPQGYTIGIPSGTVRPTGKTRGYYLLFDTLYAHGAYYYDGTTTNAIRITTTATSPATQALAADMNTQFPAIMQLVCILSADGTAGSQFSAATVGGIVNGVQSPVVPQPPPLDYSPTNGNAVLPSSFGAWYPSGYNIPSSGPVSGGGGGSTFAVTVRDANFPTVKATSNTASVGGLATFPLTGQILFTGGANVTPTAQAWSVPHSNAHVTHNGALIVSTTTNNIDQPCYATDSVSSGAGKYYWEIVANGTATPAVGIGTTAAAITDGAFVGNSALSFGWLPDGSIYTNNANTEWIRPGVGSFKDGSGNVFTLPVSTGGQTPPGQFTMNGTPVVGGDGTDAATFFNGQVMARDGTGGGGWFIFTAPSTFTFTANNPTATTAFGVRFGPGSVRLCIALDMVNLKVWMRVGATGLWNNTAIGSQNPATNLGGIPLPAGILTNVVPAVNLRLTNDTATGVFGSGSWTGTPPAGFGQIN